MCDKGFAGRDFDAAMAGKGYSIVHPARKDGPNLGTFPDRLRQRVEAIIWIFKGQRHLEDHGGAFPPVCGPAWCSASWPSTP